MSEVKVVAWDEFAEDGSPVLVVDETMDYGRYLRDVSGKHRYTSISLLRVIPREAFNDEAPDGKR